MKSNVMGRNCSNVTMKDCSFSWTNRSANIQPIDMKEKKKKKNKKERRGSTSSQGSAASGSANLDSSQNSSSNHGSSPEDPTSLSDVETLRNLNITLEAGKVIAVVGSVGCGKSSFLSAILGEMEPLNGSKIYIPHDDEEKNDFVSYCCQTPWVVNDTLR